MKPLLRVLTGGRAVKCTLGLLFFLVIADGLLTNLLVNHGIAWEFNPFLRVLAGTNVLVWVKIAGAVVCTMVLWDIYKHWSRLATISIYSFTAIYTIIVVWNITLLLALPV